MTDRNSPTARGSNFALRQALRQLHLYVGALIAPSVLFFSFTGAVQLFSLHEAHGRYGPPPLVEKLGRLHKDQVFALKPRRDPPAAGRGMQSPPIAEKAAASPATIALKGFFLVVAMGLAVSTSLGIWIGLTQGRRRLAILLVLVFGTLTPIILVGA